LRKTKSPYIIANPAEKSSLLVSNCTVSCCELERGIKVDKDQRGESREYDISNEEWMMTMGKRGHTGISLMPIMIL
jgi:hypothetical protein